jgi:hypothetical protein
MVAAHKRGSNRNQLFLPLAGVVRYPVIEMVNEDRSRGIDAQTKLVRDGFVVMPGVLTQAEILKLRAQVNDILDSQGIAKSGGAVLPNAAAEAPALAWIFSHPMILAAVRQATGLDEMVFTMEADLHRNYLNANWHKDTGEQVMEDGYFGCEPIGSPDCRVYKVALYLQDHSQGVGGLHVRPGSLATPRLDQGTDTVVNTHEGDLVVFDVRITHRGIRPGALDWALMGTAKLLSPKHPNPLAARLRRASVRLSRRPDRIAVYFAFGMPNHLTEQFAQRNMERQLSQLHKKSAPLPEPLIESFSRSGVTTVSL